MATIGVMHGIPKSSATFACLCIFSVTGDMGFFAYPHVITPDLIYNCRKYYAAPNTHAPTLPVSLRGQKGYTKEEI